MRITFTAAAAVLALACSAGARAASCATVAIAPAAPAIPAWNPIAPAEQSATFTLTLTRTASSTRRARVILLDTDSSAVPLRIGAGNGPRYLIDNLDSGAVISFPRGTQVGAQTVPLTQFPSSGNSNATTLNLRVRVLANSSPIEDFIGGARFVETLGLAVQCFKTNGSDNGTDSLLSGGPTLALTIPRLASIVTAAPVNIDFGNFSLAQQQAMISVKSTSSLNVSVATANGGRMLLAGAGGNPAPNMVIPYGIRFNNVPLSPGATLFNQARAGVSGNSFPLMLTLTEGTAAGKLAGTYSDTITLSIEPGS